MILICCLILLAAAQDCPYCRWGACTKTIGGLASCSDCHTGTLVKVNVDSAPFNINEELGICMICPRVCTDCHYAVLDRVHIAPLPALNCTGCLTQMTRSYMNGTCVHCPSACNQCQCGLQACNTTLCLNCYEGYTLDATTKQCIRNTRLLENTAQEQTETALPADHGLDSTLLASLLLLFLGIFLLILGSSVGLFLKRTRNSKRTSAELSISEQNASSKSTLTTVQL